MEIPPKFAGKPPVNPNAQTELKRGRWNGKGAQGLAEDVRYYGQWMRDEAERRIGHFYPKARLPDGSEATVIAWLWARTVRSPNPAAKGAMVPLVSSFMLSTREGKKAWIEPVIDPAAPDGWRFEVRTGTLSKQDEERLIPRSRHDPKILWVDDAEIVGDRITKVRPIPRNLFTQKTERRIGELGTSCVALVVSDVSVHEAP